MNQLYSPKIVGIITAVGLTCLVLGQTRLIYDATGLFHEGWGDTWRWVLSAGFELVILGSALAFSITQDKRLRWGEIFTIVVSIAAGIVVGMTGHDMDDYARWAVVVALGVVPIQYAVAVRAGHALTTAFYQTPATTTVGPGGSDRTPAPQTPAPIQGRVTPVVSQAAPLVLSDVQSLPVQLPEAPLSGVQLSGDTDAGHDPDDVIYVHARLVEEGLTHGEIAERLGVTTRTVSRYRERAEKAGLRPVRGVRANGQTAPA
jgi:hypothetical protein